ncbi:unnamed protein product, partial [Mesorhabditis belari]|uniref:PDZ domain-containing protein n=1 Tax=Mesorhabditis belari TaxID=2138241 RepID=A0AAF3EUX9_9BILA
MNLVRKSSNSDGSGKNGLLPATRVSSNGNAEKPHVVPAEFTARMFPDVPHENVNVEMIVPNWDQGELGDYLEIGNYKEILFLNGDANFAISKLIVGDRIVALNDKKGLAVEEMLKILHQDGKVSVTVFRRHGFSPVPAARMEALRLNPSFGFTYALLTVHRQSETVKGPNMGMLGRVINNKVILGKIQNDSYASKWLAVGDALLDLNGNPVPFNNQDFIYQYWARYKDHGSFTTVVERPCSPDALDTINALIASLFPIMFEQMHMAPDAVLIGAAAAKHHKNELRNKKPKSILQVRPLTPTPSATSTMAGPVLPRIRSTEAVGRPARRSRSNENNSGKNAMTNKPLGPKIISSGGRSRLKASRSRVKELDRQPRSDRMGVIRWTKNTEYDIGTDVPEGRKLKKVEKKVKGKRSAILTFFDLF